MKVSFFVAGLPRPHQHKQNKYGVIYMKPEAKRWQKSVGWAAMAAVGAGFSPYFGPVELLLEFFFPLAKSNKEAKAGDPHLYDPDCTNLLKAAEDGIKRVVFADDCMVWSTTVRKYWCEPGKEGMQVEVTLA